MRKIAIRVLSAVAVASLLGSSEAVTDVFRATDPGVRSGAAGAGNPLDGLTGDQQAFFDAGLDDFAEAGGR